MSKKRRTYYLADQGNLGAAGGRGRTRRSCTRLHRPTVRLLLRRAASSSYLARSSRCTHFSPLPYFAFCFQCIAHRVSHLCLCRIGFLSDLGFDCNRNRGINHRSLHLLVYKVHLTHQFYNSGQTIEDWCSICLWFCSM